jgi:CRP-like cAMP-binding protein
VSKKLGEQRLNVLVGGAFFGEGALFAERINYATIRAIGFSELEMLDLDVIRELMKHDEQLRRAIKAEARKNFVIESSREAMNSDASHQVTDSRSVTQAKAENRANKMRRKKYDRAIGDKTGPPIDLLAQMSAITNAQQTGRESPVMKERKIFPTDDGVCASVS